MLEQYFVKPETLDRIRACWLSEAIERYVTWLAEQGYAARTIHSRVPVVAKFSDYTQQQGVTAWDSLLTYVEPFVEHATQHIQGATLSERQRAARHPVCQLLLLVLPEYAGKTARQWPLPFIQQAPGFFEYLDEERGLQPITIRFIAHHLRRLERYLQKIELDRLSALSPLVISAFMIESSRELGKSTLGALGSHLRVFLRYLFREDLISIPLYQAVDTPTQYRLSTVPRAISWDEVRHLLESIDRRTPVGKRDYAILLLLVTYGVRAREIAALTLEDIDWTHDQLRVPQRKAGHASAYPLAPIVGQALIEYLQHGRPKTDQRCVFFRAQVPYRPVNWVMISQMVGRRLRRASIRVARPGSHTLRYACVQHLIEARFDLDVIGNYVGHGSPATTAGYSKIDVETLRDVALGNGEDVL